MSVYTIEDLRAEFELRYPQMIGMARAHFPFLPAQKKDDGASNAVSLAWKYAYAAYAAGKINADNAWSMIKHCLWYGVIHTRSGRTIEQTDGTGSRGKGRQDAYDNAKNFGQLGTEVISFFVSADTNALDAAQFKIDMRDFMDTLTDRQRQIAYLLMDGYGTTDVASIMGITPGAVSQFRTRFKAIFDEFFHD